MTRTSRPRHAFPLTIVHDGEMVHLIGGETVRFSVPVGPLAPALALMLEKCDGSLTREELVEPLGHHRAQGISLINRLMADRVLFDDLRISPQRRRLYGLSVEGDGPLGEGLGKGDFLANSVQILVQDDLNFAKATAFNRKQLKQDQPWMWATTGLGNRGLVSPVFFPESGPCLECLLNHYRSLSSISGIYEILNRHADSGGPFAKVNFHHEGVGILQNLIRWKVRMLGMPPPPIEIFRLHVLDQSSMETSLHRVFIDPHCPECADARMA